MIVVITKNDINIKALNALTQNNAEKYIYLDAETDFSNITDTPTSLTILDLTSNGSFQDSYAAKPLADNLIKIGLPVSIQSINLLVSDIDIKHSLVVYGPHLAEALATHNRSLQINIIRSTRHAATCIAPPENKDDNWALYGTNNTDIAYQISPPFHNGLSWFLSQKDQVSLLWEGKDLLDLLKQYGMTFSPNKPFQLSTASEVLLPNKTEANTGPNTPTSLSSSSFSNTPPKSPTNTAGTLFPAKRETRSEFITPPSSSTSSSEDELFSEVKKALSDSTKKTNALLLSLTNEEFLNFINTVDKVKAELKETKESSITNEQQLPSNKKQRTQKS